MVIIVIANVLEAKEGLLSCSFLSKKFLHRLLRNVKSELSEP